MRLSHSLIAAGALLVATPALAQDNAAAPANTVANNGVEANSANATAAGPVSPTTAAATPGTQNATLPQSAPPAAETQAPATVSAHRKFPWGVIGLLGLIGLFGVRKIKG